ncbi:MAG: L-threonylcarbamoyladenylate synthase [Anaerolineae bacterium]
MTQTRLFQLDPYNPDQRAIAIAAATLRAGQLVAFPTETVYGLGANALDASAIQRIFEAKRRPTSDPIIAHLASKAQLPEVAINIPQLAWTLIEQFWPGPLTLVLKRHPRVPAILSANLDTIAVRSPHHPIALALLQAAGLPIGAPSANLFAHPSPTTAQHVLQDLSGRVEVVLDGGPTAIGVESTVLDLTQSPPVVLRPGGVPFETLHQHLPEVTLNPRYLSLDDSTNISSSPGMLTKHYSPQAKVWLFTGPLRQVLAHMQATAKRLTGEGQKVGLLLPDEEQNYFSHLPAQLVQLGSETDLSQIAANLFAGLRELDSQGVEAILVRDFGREGLGLAIWDRLYRAAEGQVIAVSGFPI